MLFGSAYGRTAGSYCGRLRWFLGTIDGDFRRVSSQAMLALQQQRDAAPPVAAIPAAPLATPAAASAPASASVTAPVVAPIAGPAARPAVPTESRVAARDVATRSVPLAPVSTSATDLRIGRTLPPPVAALPPPPANMLPSSEQIKTLLAAVGIIAVLYQALRLLGWAIG